MDSKRIVRVVVISCLAISATALAAAEKIDRSRQDKSMTRIASAGVSPTTTIDNGVTGDGFWEVTVENACDTSETNLDQDGAAGLTDVTFDFQTYLDVGADGSATILGSSASSSATLTGLAEVESSGSFAGPDGTISWTATCTVPQGEIVYSACFDFSSSDPFGTVRLVSYYDQDVLGVSDDVLIVIGTPGASDFQLLTLDDDNNVGVGHTASFTSGTNVTYVGWAADEFSDLRTAIEGSGASYSVAGVVDTTSLPPITDPRFPSDPAYGPADITDAFAFDLAPGATTASVCFQLGGSLTGEVPGDGPTQPTALEIPTVGSVGLLALILLLVGSGWLVLRPR